MQNHRALFILCIAFAAGCSSSSTNPPSSSNPNPAVGSTFTYHITQYVPSGIIGSQFDSTMIVTSHEASWNGQANVVLFDSGATAYVYGATGNLTSYMQEQQPYHVSPEWIIFPFNGDAGKSVEFINTISQTDIVTTAYMGFDTLTINGISVPTQKVRLTDSVSYTIPHIGTKSYISTSDYWYAPSIGQMAQIQSSAWTEAAVGRQHGKTTAILTSYSLK